MIQTGSDLNWSNGQPASHLPAFLAQLNIFPLPTFFLLTTFFSSTKHFTQPTFQPNHHLTNTPSNQSTIHPTTIHPSHCTLNLPLHLQPTIHQLTTHSAIIYSTHHPLNFPNLPKPTTHPPTHHLSRAP